MPLLQTKLGVFCNKIIEAGWLAAAVVTLLFLSWYGNGVFEASKVILLRSMTVVMLAAWLSPFRVSGPTSRTFRSG